MFAGTLAIWAMLGSHSLALAVQEKLVVTYEMNRWVTLGEPILLTYRLRNVSQQVISVKFGTGADQGFLRIEVTDPDGRIQVMPPEDYGVRVPSVPLSGRRGLQGYVLLTRYGKFDKTGDYRIKVSYEGEATDGPPDQQGKALNVERSRTLSLSVAPRNPSALLQRGKEWLALATGPEPDITKQRRAAEALSLIDDPIVIPLWDELIRSGKGFESYAFAALVRVGGAEARRVLTAIAANDDNKSLATRAKKALADLQKVKLVDAEFQSALMTGRGFSRSHPDVRGSSGALAHTTR